MGFRLFIGAASLCASFLAALAIFAQSPVTVNSAKGYLILGETAYHLDGATLPHPDALCQNSNNDWPCGKAAWQILADRVIQGTLECSPLVSLSTSASTEGSLSAECTLNGESLNATLVRYGWALTNASPAAPFQKEEALAREEALGIWHDGFVPPDNWRKSDASDCGVCSARHESIVRSRERHQPSTGEASTD